MDQLAAGVRAAIEVAATGPPVSDRKFNKDGEFIAYGLKVPAWRALMRGFRPLIRELSLDQRLDLAEALFAEGEGWLGHSAIYVLSLSVRDRLRRWMAELYASSIVCQLPELTHSLSKVDAR